MKEHIEHFTDQIRHAMDLAAKASLSPRGHLPLRNIVIVGMGGSGIAGTIAIDIFSKRTSIPVSVVKDYFLPEFVGPHTLVIASSYSGDTEETLSAFTDARARGAAVVIVTSGGKLLAQALEHHTDHIVIPGGMPPRVGLAYSLVPLFSIFHAYQVIDETYIGELAEALALLEKEEGSIQLEAKKIAQHLHKRMPLIYAPAGFEGVAVRFRQQLNENAKVLASHAMVPEMNHNELVGWASGDERYIPVFFRVERIFERTNKRMDISKDIIEAHSRDSVAIFSRGTSPVAQMLYLIHLGDTISYALAELRGVDSMEVNIITHLKAEMAK